MFFEEVAKYYDKIEDISSRLSMIDVLAEMLGKAGKDEIRQLIYMTQGLLAPPFEGVQIGMAEKLAESAISIATGYERREIEARYKKVGDLGSVAEEFAGRTRLKRMREERSNVAEVFETMLKIAKTSGSGSVELKTRALASLIASSNPLGARYIVRFALGTLRLGVGDATIMEALSKAYTGDRKSKKILEDAYNISADLGRIGHILAEKGVKGIEHINVGLFSPIRPALAERMNTAEEILERMGGECAVESKYDGFRAQIHVDTRSKRVEIFSRNLEKTTSMFPEIAKAALEQIDAKDAIFEGEAIAYDIVTNEFHSFQETIQRKRKHGVEEKSLSLPLHLFAFDLLYANGESYLSNAYLERHKKLQSIIKNRETGTILSADMIVTNSPKELEKYFETAIENGLEGIVAKDLKAPYIAGARKFSWIKMKRSYKSELSDSIDLAIVGFYAGRGARAEFQFGGLLGAVYNDKKDIFETITRIGTGFTEEQMSFFRSTLDRIKVKNKPARVDAVITPDFWTEPKYVVTVRADEITKSPTHTCGREKNEKGIEAGYALRFPRIISGGIRKDKSAEDATTTKEIIEMFKLQKRSKIEEK